MKVPERYLDLMWRDAGDSAVCRRQGLVGDGGEIIRWPEWNPLGGFIPIEYPYGDIQGLYWPIGLEDRDPIFCRLWDEWPWDATASSLEGWVRMSVFEAGDEIDEYPALEYVGMAEAIGCELPEPKPGGEPSNEEFLEIDPRSPKTLVAAADEAAKAGELELAESRLLTALEVLPEYSGALCKLAGLYRRMRRPEDAARRALEAAGCPPAFGYNSDLLVDTLRWLKRVKDKSVPEVAFDPLWRVREGLRFDRPAGESHDFKFIEEAIAGYFARGEVVRAVRLRILFGDLLCDDRDPFRERIGYTEEDHRAKLKEDMIRAGLGERVIGTEGK